MVNSPQQEPGTGPEQIGKIKPPAELGPVLLENPETVIEKTKTAIEARQEAVAAQGEQLANAVETRVAGLAPELQLEASGVLAATKAEIDKNNAELQAEQDRVAKELEDLFFKKGGDLDPEAGGPLPTEEITMAEQDAAAKELAALLNLPEGETKTREQESKFEAEKQQEVGEYLAGLKAMLADPKLSEDDRAEIEEQVAGLEEAVEEAQATGQTIYEPISKPAASEGSVTKILPLKPEFTKEAIELKEKIDELAKEIDERGARRVLYDSHDFLLNRMIGKAKINPEVMTEIIDGLFTKKQNEFAIVKAEFPEAKPMESLAYVLAGADSKNNKFGDYIVTKNINDQEQAIYFLSMARAMPGIGQPNNTVRINALIPQELAEQLGEFLKKNRKAAQALMLKLLPDDLPEDRMDELKKAPKYIGGEVSAEEINLPPLTPKPEPKQTKAKSASALMPVKIVPAPASRAASVAPAPAQAAVPTRTPDALIAPSAAPNVSPNIPPTPDRPRSNEQLLAERRMLQAEWEKEATKLAEHKMSKEEQKQYKELLTGRVVKKPKKGKFTAEERKKFIGDVGFTAADYEQMKRGGKEWTLNAIWKRLGEIDKEMAAGRPAAPRAAAVPPSAGELAGIPTGEATVPDYAGYDQSQEPAPVSPDLKKKNEKEKILNGILAKINGDHQADLANIKKTLAANPEIREAIKTQAEKSLIEWENGDLRSVSAALVPIYAAKEEINFLPDEDLLRIKDRFINNLRAVILMVEENPDKKIDLGEAEAKAVRAEIMRAIQLDDNWYKNREAKTLNLWRAAQNTGAIKKLLIETMYIDPDNVVVLRPADLDAIRLSAVEYLTTLTKVMTEPDLAANAVNESSKAARKKELTAEINAAMKQMAELRNKVYRREKGAAAKLRTAGSRLKKLRAERGKLK